MQSFCAVSFLLSALLLSTEALPYKPVAYTQQNEKVDQPAASVTATCSNGLPPPPCYPQPCSALAMKRKGGGCPRYPNAMCVPDECSNCLSRYYLSAGGQEVTDDCFEQPAAITVTCPNGSPPPFCYPLPCSVLYEKVYGGCPNHRDAICVPDECSNCRARYYESITGVELTDICTSVQETSNSYGSQQQSRPSNPAASTYHPVQGAYATPSSSRGGPVTTADQYSYKGYGYSSPVKSEAQSSRNPYRALPSQAVTNQGYQQQLMQSYYTNELKGKEETTDRVYKPYTAGIQSSRPSQVADDKAQVQYALNRVQAQANRLTNGYSQGQSVAATESERVPAVGGYRQSNQDDREELLDAYAAGRKSAFQQG